MKADENAEEHASDEILSAANNVLFLTASLRDRSLRGVPDCFSFGNGEGHHRSARLGADFCRHSSTCVRASFSEKLEGSLLKLLAAAIVGIAEVGLVVQPGLATVTAFQVRPARGAGLFSLLGTLIIVKWSSSSVWAIGILVGLSVWSSASWNVEREPNPANHC
ncbi:MAG TPA: hypothetical protein VEI52_20815 [Terriglobales bacterium]|nr:hypothetical protein [Terriglobales bacterium]